MKAGFRITPIAAVILIALLSACSSTKHVPDGQYLLDKVTIAVQDSAGHNVDEIDRADLSTYLRQTPNHKVLGFLKLQLATYSLSGADTSKWYNRWLRKIGQAPVIYDSALTAASARQLQLAMSNRGYMNADIEVDSMPRPDKKKMEIVYRIYPGEPHRIASVAYEIPDSAIARIVFADTSRLELHPGDRFDRNVLDNVRVSITDRLRQHGYYAFNKEYITFYADTVAGSKAVALTMTVRPPMMEGGAMADSTVIHRIHYIRNVVFVTNYYPGEPIADVFKNSRSRDERHGYITLYGQDRYLKPDVLIEKCFLTPGHRYSSQQVDRSYEYMSQLGILRTINIEFVPVQSFENEVWMDAYVLMTRNKKQSVALELEGTNSEGDLGFGIGLSYQHRNLANGSQQLTAKYRTSYESLSGDLSNLINDAYTEQAAEVGLTFPRFMFPFLTKKMRHRLRASSELSATFNYQERPEYTRVIAGLGWKYKWNNRSNTERRTWDFMDINYVYLPKSTINFIDEIAPNNPLLRYSYEDHLIMRMAYTYQLTNKKAPTSVASTSRQRLQSVVYSVRAMAETAGNFLYALSSVTGQKRQGGVYKVFGTQYSQYVKAEVDYTVARNFSPRHSLAFHAGAGVGVPYGNSEAIPFEKRFYAGGANGVRGWGVRTLGPGSYDSRNSVNDFINQCGDIRLDLNLEYRMKLFWVLEGGLFIDGGNIWTIRDYENQPGGVFKIDKFWKQIALAYGVGLRMDFTYFILRLDLGMKAYNPAMNQERWPLVNPSWHRDATFHFAVGYPF